MDAQPQSLDWCFIEGWVKVGEVILFAFGYGGLRVVVLGRNSRSHLSDLSHSNAALRSRVWRKCRGKGDEVLGWPA